MVRSHGATSKGKRGSSAKSKKATPAKDPPQTNIKKRSPPPKDPPTTKGNKGSPRALVPPVDKGSVPGKGRPFAKAKKGGRGAQEEDMSPVRKIPPKASHSATVMRAPKRAPPVGTGLKKAHGFRSGGCPEETLLPNENKRVTMPDMVAMTASEVLETLEMSL